MLIKIRPRQLPSLFLPIHHLLIVPYIARATTGKLKQIIYVFFVYLSVIYLFLFFLVFSICLSHCRQYHYGWSP